MKKGGAAAFAKDVPPEYSFWLCDGRVIRNLKSLADALSDMKSSTYSYHANSMKNDFADWIRDIVKDQQLSEAVRKAGRSQAAELIAKKTGLRLPKVAATEAKPDKPTPVASQPAPVKIQKAVKKAQPITRPEPKLTVELLKKMERELGEKEKKLNEEEDRANQRKIELTKERYELLKKRGELERKKFEYFMSRRSAAIRLPELPKIDAAIQPAEFTRDRLEELITQARSGFESGKQDEAVKKLTEAQQRMGRIPLKTDEKRHSRLQIMELEADLKLATIKQAA